MSREHFRNLKDVYRTEGIWQAVKYDFDKSVFRLLIPYAAELSPVVLGVKNYETLVDKAVGTDDGQLEKKIKKAIAGAVSIGSEVARYIITAITYNETKSLEAAVLAYLLSSSFFSVRNQFRVNRFYKSNNNTYTAVPIAKNTKN